MRFRVSCLLAALACATGALWSAHADAQIRRCTRPDGEVVFTDRACADVGGVARPKPSVHSPVYGGKSWARGCSRSLRDLIFEVRSEEHTSELQSLMRNSYAVFFLK